MYAATDKNTSEDFTLILKLKKSLSSIKIKATIQKHGRYPKVRIVKFKRRKHYMRTQGHRQGFSEIKIESIK